MNGPQLGFVQRSWGFRGTMGGDDGKDVSRVRVVKTKDTRGGCGSCERIPMRGCGHVRGCGPCETHQDVLLLLMEVGFFSLPTKSLGDSSPSILRCS